MRSYTQLTGTTATNSNELYPTSFTTLAGNNSASAVAIGKALINDQHRYLLQKYFDNERTFQISTVGAQSLTLTATLASAAVSATLTAAWTYPTCTQLVTFSNSNQREVTFTLNSTTITWAIPLTATATTAITTIGVQNYSIPANVSKIKNDTINVGQLKYQPKFITTIQEWDQVNFLPYTSDIPAYCFIYNGTLRLFPIPSTTGNIITGNFKARVPDLSFADYSTGTLTLSTGMVAGSVSVNGTSTSWNATGGYALNTDLSVYNLYIRANQPYGDGIWYPISKFTSDTALTLALPVINAPNITAATTYTIGQMPLLHEDFHDMLVYGALRVYFSGIVPDKGRLEEFTTLYNEKLALLADYTGTKQVNVDLGGEINPINPNLFLNGS